MIQPRAVPTGVRADPISSCRVRRVTRLRARAVTYRVVASVSRVRRIIGVRARPITCSVFAGVSRVRRVTRFRARAVACHVVAGVPRPSSFRLSSYGAAAYAGTAESRRSRELRMSARTCSGRSTSARPSRSGPARRCDRRAPAPSKRERGDQSSECSLRPPHARRTLAQRVCQRVRPWSLAARPGVLSPAKPRLVEHRDRLGCANVAIGVRFRRSEVRVHMPDDDVTARPLRR
jgi:hypothetical protein